jgi:hypothetical protein
MQPSFGVDARRSVSVPAHQYRTTYEKFAIFESDVDTFEWCAVIHDTATGLGHAVRRDERDPGITRARGERFRGCGGTDGGFPDSRSMPPWYCASSTL